MPAKSVSQETLALATGRSDAVQSRKKGLITAEDRKPSKILLQEQGRPFEKVCIDVC